MDKTNVLQACHGVSLVTFVVVAVFAGRTVCKLRHTSAPSNQWLLPFAYFSLSSWIFWVLQYITFLAGPFISFPSGHLQKTVLWLGIMQNALWASALLSLHSKRFPRMSLTVPLLILVSIVIALVTYLPPISIFEPLTQIDTVSAVAIFTVFAAYSIAQLRLSRVFAAVFFIHGFIRWIWKPLWFDPLNSTPIVLLLFSGWHITLLFIWIQLILEIRQRPQPLYQRVSRDIQRPEMPNPPVTFRVMISSTVEDLVEERKAADRAIQRLYLDRFRAETFGSLPDTPQAICAWWAEQCDIFILIIGERYGYRIESGGMSVVEFEYSVARQLDRGKILVYVKNGVNREPPVKAFLTCLQDFEHGHVTSPFTTPEDLAERIQQDIVRWLTSHARQK